MKNRTQLLPAGYEMTITPQPWIPVSERLPERSGAVLGFLARSTAKGDHDYHMAWRHMDDRPGLRWNGPGEPTHWMPLPPEPPEAK
jgi:hypothetical protein